MSNVMSFIGTVGRDCEVKHTPAGMAILTVSVANNTGYGDKKKTTWFRVNLFGKRAEGQLQDFLKKGTSVFISGELSQSEYTAKDGTTKVILEVNANIIDLVGSKQMPSQPNAQPVRTAPAPTGYDDFNDDLPF